MSRYRTCCKPLLALLLALGVAAGLARGAGAATLAERLDRALTVRGVSRAYTGAMAINLRSGNTVYTFHRSLALKPASNEKLPVALAVLEKLGPARGISTPVLGEGRLDGAVWRGRLVLQGHGDPSLNRADLARLASRLRAVGIRRVTGRILGDESYFDRRRVCRGWKPEWYKVESPPLSALVVNRARVRRRVVDNPAKAAAVAFRAALRATGIAVPGPAVVGTAGPGAVSLARVRSAPLARLVRRMNKVSDNFYAEMLVKHLGAKIRGTGSTSAGTAVVKTVLRNRGVPMQGVRIVDGSGLSVYDRLTARALAALLISAWSDPAVKAAFTASLSVAGVDGTLEDRMLRGPAHGFVRAKTGTTTTASALSGYVGSKYVFVILQNGNPIPWWYARRAQDRFAQILAGAAR